MSDKPSLALLFDVRVESCRSCSNSFGASAEVWGQGGRAESENSVHRPDQFLSVSRTDQSYLRRSSRDPSPGSSPS